MPQKEDRWAPLLITALFTALTYYLFTYRLGFHLSFLVKKYLLGTVFSIVLASLINLKVKISLHAIGVGGILALIAGLQRSAAFDIRWLFSAWLLCCGLTGAARIKLESHRPAQVYLGFLLGFSIIFLSIRS
jgi:hypothetical protein